MKNSVDVSIFIKAILLMHAATLSVGCPGGRAVGTSSSSIGGIVGGVVTAIILILTLNLILVVLTVLSALRHKRTKGEGVCLLLNHKVKHPLQHHIIHS